MGDFVIKNSELTKYTGTDADVAIPDGVTGIGKYAFYFSTSLTSVTIPNSVTTIGPGAFSGCKKLMSVTIPDSVTVIDSKAFSECSRLMSIAIPNSVTVIGGSAFYGCTNLKDVTIPESVTAIGEYAFKRCTNLTSAIIMGSAATIGEYAFSGCGRLTHVTILDGVTAIGNGAFYGCTSLTGVIISGSAAAIGEHAFYECANLTSITIPDGVRSIGEHAFSCCTNLASVTIPNSVTVIGSRAFSGCGKLTDIIVPDSVTSIGEKAFGTNLKSIVIPAHLAKQFYVIFGTATNVIIHISDISDVSARYRPMCAVGFAEDGRDHTDGNGKRFINYIKANAVKLIRTAMEHPALFYLMVREKLITAKDLEAITSAVQAYGNAEYISAMLEYGNRSVSAEDKARVAQKQEERDENVTSFIFDTENLEKLQGKKFAVTGKLKTFVSHDEFRECLEAGGAILTEDFDKTVNYLIAGVTSSGTAKTKAAIALNIPLITEDEFNEMIGRKK